LRHGKGKIHACHRSLKIFSNRLPAADPRRQSAFDLRQPRRLSSRPTISSHAGIALRRRSEQVIKQKYTQPAIHSAKRYNKDERYECLHRRRSYHKTWLFQPSFVGFSIADCSLAMRAAIGSVIESEHEPTPGMIVFGISNHNKSRRPMNVNVNNESIDVDVANVLASPQNTSVSAEFY
jgi:hypothetical protein